MSPSPVPLEPPGAAPGTGPGLSLPPQPLGSAASPQRPGTHTELLSTGPGPALSTAQLSSLVLSSPDCSHCPRLPRRAGRQVQACRPSLVSLLRL